MSSNIGDNNDNQLCGDGGGGSSPEEMMSKKECTSCEQNNVDNISEGINSLSILHSTSTCANCGKVDNSDDMNTCNKCKEVKYCNAACKKKHRTKHKKACERRVAELHDEQLFKDPPPPEECPICLLTMPHTRLTMFETCCGKRICDGCEYAMAMSEGKDLCAFCRTPEAKTDKETIKRVQKLMDKGDGEAFNCFAGYYTLGQHGLSQDYRKANELLLKAGELGYSDAYNNLGNNYLSGRGVEIDKMKAKYYWELAAIKGNVNARHNIGTVERNAGNYERAMKHYIIAAKSGGKESLHNVKLAYMDKIVTKDEYASTLRAHQQRLDEMKSVARDRAAEVYGP